MNQHENEQKPEDQKARARSPGAAWIAIGAGVGAAIGVAIGSIGVGIAVGVAIGVALMAAMNKKPDDK